MHKNECDNCSKDDIKLSIENPIMEQCVSIPIPEKELLELTEKAKDWAIMHGAGMRSKKNFSPDSLNVNNQYTFDVFERL